MEECVVDLSVASDALKPQTALSGEKRLLPGMQKQGSGSIEFPGGDWEKVRRHRPELYVMVQNSIPFGRLGTPAEVADAAVWLVSSRANCPT